MNLNIDRTRGRAWSAPFPLTCSERLLDAVTGGAKRTIVAALVALLCLASGAGMRPPTDWVLRHPAHTVNHLYGIAYGAGWFVAVGENGTVLTSRDGLSWGSRPTGEFGHLRGTVYGNGQFVAVGTRGSVDAPLILSSSDTVVWTRQAGGTTSLNRVAFGGGQFVAVGERGHIVTSVDGTTWWTRRQDNVHIFFDITFANGLFVVVGGG